MYEWEITEHKNHKFSRKQHIVFRINYVSQYFIYTEVLSIEVSVRRGCSVSGFLMLNEKILSKKFPNYDHLGGLEIRRYEKWLFVLQKRTSLRESTSFEPFYVNVVNAIVQPVNISTRG